MLNESLDINELIKDRDYHQLIDELKIGIYIFDSSGSTVWSNIHFQSMFGYNQEELATKSLFDLFHTQDALLIRTGSEYVSNNHPQLRGKRKGDGVIYLKLISCHSENPQGTIVKVQDITEQVQADFQLVKTCKELEDLKYALDQAATVSITDVNGDLIYVNDKFVEISKYDRKELIGQNHRIVKSGHHPKEVFENLWQTISKGKVWKGEVCNMAKDGTIWWGGATIVPYLDEHGRPYQYIGIRSDITDKKLMEAEIQKRNEIIKLSERRFRSLVEHSYDIIILLNEQGVVEYISPNAVKMNTGPIQEIMGVSAFDFLPEEDRAKAEKLLGTILRVPFSKRKSEVRVVDKDGSLHFCEVVLTNLLTDPAVKAISVNLRDITENKLAEQKIFEMANYDFLTKLPNKNLFETLLQKELEQAKENGTKFSLLLLDLHGMKFVNDTLGSQLGDQLLQKAAIRLKKFVGDKGIVSRFDGVEFTILLPDYADSDIDKISEDILHLFEQPFFIHEYELFLTANIGISFYPESGQTVQALMKNAYSAVHQANENGPNKYQVFSSKLNIVSYKRFTLTNDLRRALKNNEFFVSFQPRVDVRTNKIIAAEALVRWNHPKWGIVGPFEFISLAEKNGLIGQLGEIVLLKACQQLKRWQETGLAPIKVSVNFSVLQFLQTDIIQTIERVLHCTELEPNRLEIEITESILMENEAIILGKISRLKKMGIGIAIDDFGTGYSSLGYLKKLQADILKIDRSFIKGIPEDNDSTDIVAAIVQLAKKLNIRIVAEGVETIEQLSFLENLDCDEIQGYLYSKPLVDEDFGLLLKVGVCHPKLISNTMPADYDNRRGFMRIETKYPLSGEMTISVIDGEKVKLGSTKILILDIGPGGLRIETNVKLPVRSDMILQFSTMILGQKLDLYGTVVWRKEIDDFIQSYGISFIMENEERKQLTTLLRKFQVKLRKKQDLADCSFVIEHKQR
ncbi:EAL domain-containing protein [Bacillus tuaregi]|uniref:EAL domain-containing protein n=1 Tax=Bacillus tuaregi TaxID=1816695 RepID=UPI000B275247|nr:EAL domain-containing protein [Bacillus tuaregi]